MCESWNSVCDGSGVGFNGSCYELTAADFNTYEEAADSCRAKGAVLASIASADENEVVKEACSTQPQPENPSFLESACWNQRSQFELWNSEF